MLYFKITLEKSKFHLVFHFDFHLTGDETYNKKEHLLNLSSYLNFYLSSVLKHTVTKGNCLSQGETFALSS